MMKNLLANLSQRSDLALAVLLIAIIFMMVLPLPTEMVDGLIAFNFAIAVLLLMLSVYMKSALEFSAFPAILLLSTLFRLALSVTTTRLILMDGDAGEIITTFGNFVVGGNLVVGMIIFLIITIVQFLVITKGAERVAEVSARFSLDALPGKQMSIDGDMRAGVLDIEEARDKRESLNKESQLFGSMDGAMKFVKGDAIAGLIIIIINIFGGILIGVAQLDMSTGEALEVYSILTIGDGLIAQIPALFISITAGMIVTRVSSNADDDEKDTHLGNDIGSQITAHPKAMYVSSALLAGFAIIPGFPTIVFIFLSLLLGVSGFWLSRKARKSSESSQSLPEILAKNSGSAAAASKESKKASARQAAQGSDDFSLTIPLLVDVATGLETVLDATELNAALAQVRKALYLDLGVPFPGVHLRFNDNLKESEYCILHQEIPVSTGKLLAGCVLVTETVEALELAEIEFTEEDPFLPGTKSIWVAKEYLHKLEDNNLSYMTLDRVVTYHLAFVLRRYAEEFIGIQESRYLLDKVEPHFGELVKEAQRVIPIQRISEVFQRLVSEEVSIRNLRVILESLVEWGQKEKDVVQLTEYVRGGLKRQICFKYSSGSTVLPTYLLEQGLEEEIRGAIRQTSAGYYLALDPGIAKKMVDRIMELVGDLKLMERRPVLLVAMDIRRYVRKLIESDVYDLPVLSFQELTKDINVQAIGRISI
ncbi:type III secretion system export apparatus subunit SctV [Pleionea sediminis]|uniref:type III secretion system export apparatus subunit SctV n=1 Tax=Pleionea sediminis TaxID=2569479 RepID=UPI0013DDF200|nr:type III secretion system export apparatus subunit SctV [Pleionea sediminis]